MFPFILIASNLAPVSTLIFTGPNNGAGIFGGLEMRMIPCVEAEEDVDFVVREGEEVTIQDVVFTPSGDIIVEEGGRLTIRDAKVIFTHTSCFEHGIILKENTTLQVHHSQIRGVETLFFFRAQDTTLILEDSKIRMTHVLCGNSSRISMVHADLWALHCFNESTVDISNSRLNYLFMRGRSSAQVEDSHIVEVLLYDRGRASLSNTTLKNIFYFDRGSTTLSNCSYVDLIRFKPIQCNLTITVLDEDTHDPIPMVNVALDRPRGSKVAHSCTNEDGAATFYDLEEGDYFVELGRDGYIPANIRIPLLNETQHETLMIGKVEEESSWIPTNRFFSVFAVVALAVFVFSLFYRSHVRRWKSAVDWLQLLRFFISVPKCTMAR